MSQMTLTQEEMQEALSFYLNQRILKMPHTVTQIKVKKSDSHSHIPKEFEVEMEKAKQTQQPVEKVTVKTPITERGKGKKKGPLEAAIKN